MTNNLHIPRRLEGEHETELTSSWGESQDADITDIEQISLEAVINVLIKRGICTETELFAEENRLRTSGLWTSEENMASTPFAPVRTYSERDGRHHEYDTNPLRRWAAKRPWSRRLGSLLFGWKWHRKKRDQKI